MYAYDECKFISILNAPFCCTSLPKNVTVSHSQENYFIQKTNNQCNNYRKKNSFSNCIPSHFSFKFVYTYSVLCRKLCMANCINEYFPVGVGLLGDWAPPASFLDTALADSCKLDGDLIGEGISNFSLTGARCGDTDLA